MFLRGLTLSGAVLAGLWSAGCYNSDSDYQALLAENNTLGAELAAARRENEILTRALDNIKREQETLQMLLNAGKSSLLAGRASLPAAPPSAGSAPPAATPQTARAQSPAAALQTARAQSPAAADPDWAEEWQTPATLAAATAQPAGTRPATPPQTSGGGFYVTKPGDVLSNIALAHHTSVEKILELNPSLRNRRNHLIYDNERLKLP